MEYIIELTESTKMFPKKSYYKYEIQGILHDTEDPSQAFIAADAPELIKYIEENYDYHARAVEHKPYPQAVTEGDIDKIIDEVEDMHPYKEAGNADSYSQYNEGWADACDILGERIKAAMKKGGQG